MMAPEDAVDARPGAAEYIPDERGFVVLVINKTDLAPHVGADLDLMARDANLLRSDRPFLFTNLKRGIGLPDVVSWIQRDLLYEERGIG
jgi:hypothetical protein